MYSFLFKFTLKHLISYLYSKLFSFILNYLPSIVLMHHILNLKYYKLCNQKICRLEWEPIFEAGLGDYYNNIVLNLLPYYVLGISKSVFNECGFFIILN